MASSFLYSCCYLLTVIVCLKPVNVHSASVVANSDDWPDTFTSKFTVMVEQYGKDWSSEGGIFYDWNKKAFRGEFLDWCLPLFDSGPTDQNDYSCSFLAIDGNMYFVNYTGRTWEENDCCMFEKGLGAVPPNWMFIKSGMRNGTHVANGILCNVFWFPFNKDLCYGYWDSVANSIPIRFFGISSLGPTILNYHDYKPHHLPDDAKLVKPNDKCEQKCVPPSSTSSGPSQRMRRNNQQYDDAVNDWPDEWPACY